MSWSNKISSVFRPQILVIFFMSQCFMQIFLFYYILFLLLFEVIKNADEIDEVEKRRNCGRELECDGCGYCRMG